MDAEEHQVALNEAKAVSGVVEAAEKRGAAQGEELAREYGNQIGKLSSEATAAFFQALAQKPEKITQAVSALPDEHKARTVEALSDDLSDEEFERIAARRAAKRKPPAAPPPS